MKQKRGLFRLLNTTFAGYRVNIAQTAALGSLSALIDGVTISAIIPLVSFLLGSSEGGENRVTLLLRDVFELLHVPFQFRTILIFIVLLVLARMAVQSWFMLIRARMNARFVAEATTKTFARIFDARWEFVLREKGGHLQSVVLWDTRRVGVLLDTVAQIMQSVTGFLMYILVAITISPLVTVITLGAGGILLFLLRPLMKRTRHFGEEMTAAEKELAHVVGEQIGGFKAVKSAGAALQVKTLAGVLVERYRRAYTRSSIVQSLGAIFIQPFGILFAVGLFSVSYILGQLDLAAFAAVLYLIQKIFVYLDSAQTAIHAMHQAAPYAENMHNFIERASANREKQSQGTSFSFEKDVVFDDVSLSYEGRAHALSNISFAFEKGSYLAIIGPSGGGKTSLVDLLLRLFTPTKGAIRVDGTPLESISLTSWRSHIAYVSQDSFLMHASVADNIRFFDDSLTDSDIERAARMAHIYDEIQSLPDKFDTVLGDRGVTLSGGQKQRIALARALARAPEILVLDEVTSALDSAIEAQIKEVIDDLRGQMTLVVIAHRVSTILNADTVIVLEKGRIVEQGTPSRMLADPDSYLSRMRALQSTGAVQ